MTTTFLFIRHGQTDWNVQGRWQGFTDIPLNEVGRAQAHALAKRLASWPLDVVYASDLERAAETAAILAAPHRLQPILTPVWRERGLGALEGLTQAEIHKNYPYLLLPRSFIEGPGSESYDKLRKRVIGGYNKLVRQHKGQTVAIITHGGTLRMIVSHVLDLPGRLFAPFHLDGNTGITRVHVDKKGQSSLSLLNDTAHLEAGLMFDAGG